MVVTGAARGVGALLARKLAARGVLVALVGLVGRGGEADERGRAVRKPPAEPV